MIDSDFAVNDTDDSFSPEEQAAWDAMRNGEAAPEPQAAAEPAAEPAAPAAAAEPAAPGEVVDPDAEDADDPEKNRGRFVRHGAFHKEREARKAAQRELTELREKFTRGDERMRILTEAARAQPAAAAQPQAEPAKAPNPEEDIFGYAKHLEQQIAELKTGFTKQTEEQRAETERKADHDHYIADAQRFAAAEPAFAAAYQHLYQSCGAELAAAGVPQDQIIPTIKAQEMDIAARARQAGRSPCEVIFAISKARGFTPKSPEPTPAPEAAAPAETAAEKQARIAAGQKGPGTSLSAAGGSPAGEVTAEMLANMSDAEFEAFHKTNGRKLRALMGG